MVLPLAVIAKLAALSVAKKVLVFTLAKVRAAQRRGRGPATRDRRLADLRHSQVVPPPAHGRQAQWPRGLYRRQASATLVVSAAGSHHGLVFVVVANRQVLAT